jgi:hypothetical protein
LPEVAFWSNCSASLFFIAFPTLFTNSVKLDLNCRQQGNALIEQSAAFSVLDGLWTIRQLCFR